MEIAINTLVVIILGVIILSGGFAILANISTVSDEIITSVDQNTQDKIATLLSSDTRVTIPHNEITSEEYGTYYFVLGFKIITKNQ